MHDGGLVSSSCRHLTRARWLHDVESMMATDREAAAWSVTSAAGLASGVILGISPNWAASAWFAVITIALIAVCACVLLVGAPLRSAARA